MFGASHFQFRHDNRKEFTADQETFVTLPSGQTLKVLSFGYRNLLADMLFIWSIQFYSAYNLTNRYDYIEHVFNVITDINPNYKEPYIVGSWIMALEKEDIPMAMRLLKKGADNMPDEWIFNYELGFYSYKNLKDYKLAEKYFKMASEKPGAPEHIHRQQAHMIYMENNLEYAYQLWQDILNKAKDWFARSAALNHLFQIKYEIDKRNLEKKIKEFHERKGRNPFNLEELVRTGMISEIPKDYTKGDYLYNPNTGRVTAYKEFKWKNS